MAVISQGIHTRCTVNVRVRAVPDGWFTHSIHIAVHDLWIKSDTVHTPPTLLWGPVPRLGRAVPRLSTDRVGARPGGL